jgi:hypothetical protein
MGDAVDRLTVLLARKRVPVVSHPRATPRGVTRVKAHMREVEWEDPGFEPPTPWEEVSEAERQTRKDVLDVWRRQLMVGVSLGKLSPQQTRERVLHSYIPGGVREEEIEPLPPRLYHATTALDAVKREGLKTRSELEGVGLGGGPSDMVSLTDDPEVAERIAEVTREAHDVLNGRFTVQEMIAKARAEGWYSKLESAAGGPEFLRHVVENEERHGVFISSRADMVEKYGEGDWRPLNLPTLKGGDGVERSSAWARTGSPEWKREHDFDFYRGPYLAAQENHFGWRDRKRMDPLFFTPNLDYLRNLDPSQIGVVEVRPVPGAQGTHEGGILGEWRTWSGAAVVIQ